MHIRGTERDQWNPPPLERVYHLFIRFFFSFPALGTRGVAGSVAVAQLHVVSSTFLSRLGCLVVFDPVKLILYGISGHSQNKS